MANTAPTLAGRAAGPLMLPPYSYGWCLECGGDALPPLLGVWLGAVAESTEPPNPNQSSR